MRRATTDSTAYLRHSMHPHYSPPAASPLHTQASFPAPPASLSPHASSNAAHPAPPTAAPLHGHWSPRTVHAVPAPLNYGQSTMEALPASSSAVQQGLRQGHARQSTSTAPQRQASRTADRVSAGAAGVASPVRVTRGMQQQAALHTGASGSTPASRTPITKQQPNVNTSPWPGATAASPRHAAVAGNRPSREGQASGVSAHVAASPSAAVVGGNPGVAQGARVASARQQDLWQQLQAANKHLQTGTVLALGLVSAAAYT